MATRRLTDNEIRIVIVPTHLRWPESGTTAAWTKLHNCVDSLHSFVRTVDNRCAEVEQKRDLSFDGIARRRTEIGRQALIELESFRPFEIAEQAATKDINFLKRRDDRDPQEAQMEQKLTKALDDLRKGVTATERLLLERCKLRERTVLNSA